MERFSREINLIGEEAFNKIKLSKIAIFGIGGVGSYVVEGLVRAGVGEFCLIDKDIVADSNINRQIIALSSTIGQPKVEVAKQRIKDINPDIKVKTFCEFVTPENIEMFRLDQYDYIVDAIDTVTAKLAIIKEGKKYNKKIISCMGTGNKLHPEMFKIVDISKTSECPLAKIVRKKLKEMGIGGVKVLYSTEKPILPIMQNEENGKRIPASISTVPSIAGLMIANQVLLDIME